MAVENSVYGWIHDPIIHRFALLQEARNTGAGRAAIEAFSGLHTMCSPLVDK